MLFSDSRSSSASVVRVCCSKTLILLFRILSDDRAALALQSGDFEPTEIVRRSNSLPSASSNSTKAVIQLTLPFKFLPRYKNLVLKQLILFNWRTPHQLFTANLKTSSDTQRGHILFLASIELKSVLQCNHIPRLERARKISVNTNIIAIWEIAQVTTVLVRTSQNYHTSTASPLHLMQIASNE